MTVAQKLDAATEKAGFIITAHLWYSIAQANADTKTDLIEQLDSKTQIVCNRFGAYYVVRNGKAARCERVNGLYFRSSAR